MICFLLLTFQLAASAQQVVPSLSADTNRILIGQHLKVQLQLSQPAGLQIDWPLFQDTIGGMEIISTQPVDTFKVDDPSMLLRSQTFIVSAYDSGKVFIPPVSFKYMAGGDKPLSVETDPLSVDVFPVPVDTTKAIRDIRPVEDAPFDYLILVWPAGILLLALLAWYLYKKWKRRPLPQVEVPSAALKPAHVTALEELEKLNNERVWQQGHFKSYHTRLTDILRVYLEQRWLVCAPELTTDEILGHAFFLGLTAETGERLERVLRLADLVKFAKLQPVPSENELAMQLAVTFVNDTSPMKEKIGVTISTDKQ